MIEVLRALSATALASIQIVPFPAPPSVFEPPEPRSTTLTLDLDCRGKVVNISTYSERTTRAIAFKFGNISLEEKQLNDLTGMLSSLKGQVHMRAMCNSSGVDIVFEESFVNSKGKKAWVEVQYLDNQLKSLGKSP